MFSEVICNRITEDAYIPACCVYRLWLWSLINQGWVEICLDIYEAQESLYLCIVSAVLLLIGVEKKTWLISRFLDQGDRQPPGLLSLTMLHPLRASGPTYVLVVVGETPSLSQTGYKGYSYSPWAVIMLSRIRDANWRLSRFVTCMRMTPIGVYRV